MGNELMELTEVEKYTNIVIPNLEDKLGDSQVSAEDKLELYNLYVELLKLTAPFNFISYNKYLELDEDHNSPIKAFYYHRKDSLKEMFDAFNDMEIKDKYDLLLISLPPRVGKEQSLTSGILTPNGWKTMGDMKLGNKVIGYDGKPCNVTGVYPQGIKDIYEVIFDDGTSVECGLDHLWTVQTRDDRTGNSERTVTTSQMMKNLYVENKTRKNYSIQYVKPVEFSNKLKSDDLHPYLIGALLGDGGLSRKSATILTSIDNDLLDRISGILPINDELSKMGDTISYRIVKKNRKLRNKYGYAMYPCTLNKIREYKLNGTHSHTKFIPTKYLYSSYENRLELLKGLMDTDGYTGDGNTYCEYTTVSEALSNDVVELIRSLGGRCTIGTKIGSYKKDGKKINCKKVYRITFNIEVNPFYIERKRIRFSPRATRNVKYICNIKKVGKSECQCIMVDSPKHLYVTDGYNLTHNTTTGIRFLSWIIGKYGDETQLAVSYSDSITTSFYIGVMEIVQNQRFKEMFPEAPLITQNAKREEIWLKVAKRYPSITFAPIGGSITGRCESSKYLYCDDLVSGIEEALSVTRLDKLWQMYTVNCKQRKKDGCKEIHLSTKWSVHDVIDKLGTQNINNPRCKIINMSCYDENEESQFDFPGGFSTGYYNEMQSTMDKASFDALFRQEPIEREGLLYHEEDLQYYFTLPEGEPDTIVAVCDSKNLGKDFVSSPIGYVYGDKVFVEDVVYNSGLPEVTQPLLANMWFKHKVVRGDIELNNGGNYYATMVNQLIHDMGGKTSLRMFFTGSNKKTKIITYSDYVVKNFVFKDPSTYSPNSEYAKFMKDLFKWTQMGSNAHDDAPDSIAMLGQLVQELTGMAIKFLDRRKLGI
jgi:predicted phage terminase large subunit-like protein